MTDSYNEEHPLICDECSDEEYHIPDVGPKFQRRFRRSASTGRARTHALGATAIITTWPDNISALLAYWWIGLGMIAVMVFLIYNSFLAIAVLPHSHYVPSKTQNTKRTTENNSNENSSIPNIYMHVFVDNLNDFNEHNYMPYVKTFAKKYTNFKYNFLVLLNDANHDTLNDLSDEKNNDLALNLLWDDKKIANKKRLYKSPTVKFISLTMYMNDSPLKKYWRLLPNQFIGFLVRCVSIWDKGGIAFNPVILIPNSHNSIYLEKLNNILEKFYLNNKLMSTKKRKTSKLNKKKYNNIRDIINDLENEDINDSIFTESLTEAENVPSVTVTSPKIKRSANFYPFDQHKIPQKQNEEILHDSNEVNNNRKVPSNYFKSIQTNNSTEDSMGIAALQKILPNFLQVLFRSNTKNSTFTQNLKNFTSDIHMSETTNFDKYLKNDTTSKIAHDPSIKITKSNTKTFKGAENTKLVIDLKGNLIATEIGCHAFIGTVFSNVLHHTRGDSVTDFIIDELSLFCKGSLSTCNNIDVIL
ncbi:uncharacterized protein LOC112048160 [Bicyclus anynana]|uniref:Uncharacterized protein LOC112048160 n=1 Tax=Bicyclus anynana TaxID=110368 RepID=A0A6J1N375_BICAN|nr:uncharacterized protein LOC112048160 [Bicyclus anynana]